MTMAVDGLGMADIWVRDPHPVYRELQKNAPVHHAPDGLWFVSGYREARVVLQDSAAASSSFTSRRDYAEWVERELDGVDGPVARWQRNLFVFMDDPAHRRLRMLFQQAFTSASMDALRSRTMRHAVELVEAAGSDLDVVSQLALPLTTTLIGELLGVPVGDRDDCVHRSEILQRTLEPFVSREELQAAGAALAESTEFFLDMIAARRADPRDDLLTALSRAQCDGDAMTEDELVATALLLFNAGFETTTALICNTVNVLLENTQELDFLRSSRSHLADAVEEVIRLEPSFHYTFRFTVKPLDLGSATIPAGEPVIVLLAAANRDPAVFDQPDRYRIVRDQRRHLSFVSGIHHCLGAPLARLEAQAALSALLSWPDFEGGPEPSRRGPSVGTLRTFDYLPIRRRDATVSPSSELGGNGADECT